jgi:hypothetical protein
MEELRFDPDSGIVASTGILQEISGQHQAIKGIGGNPEFEAKYSYAIKSESHLWVAIATYHLSESALLNSDSEQMLMDSENLLAVNFGCFICEEPYSKKVLKHRCKGEPKR